MPLFTFYGFTYASAFHFSAAFEVRAKIKHILRGDIMDNFYDLIPISENDIVININYNFCFVSKKDLHFDENWIQSLIINEFKNSTFNNAIRIKEISIIGNRIIFKTRLVNPDISADQISQYLLCKLNKIIQTLPISSKEDIWEEVGIFSAGNAEELKEEIEEYLKAIEKNKGIQ